MIQTGLTVLLHQPIDWLKGCRIGWVTHPAAVTPQLVDGVIAALRARIGITALFGPEHGLYGMAADGAAVANSVDPLPGLPVFSLYGETREPTPEMLSGVDVLVYDMQDVGVRFYTYLSTLFYTLRGAAKAGKRVVVLDRPNPVSGQIVEGPKLEPGFESFVGIAPIPLRHGLTLGELARWINQRLQPQTDLTVVPMRGWQRSLWFDQTGLEWVPTSPSMPRLSTATVYPGACLIEGTNLSEGRGTALPFEMTGAPWVDGHTLAERLNALDLPGVIFRPCRFSPTSSKYQGQSCAGVQWHVMDRQAFRPLRTGLHLIAACRELYPQAFQFLASSWEGRALHFDLLMGNAWVREWLQQGRPVQEVVDRWASLEAGFLDECQDVLLYTP